MGEEGFIVRPRWYGYDVARDVHDIQAGGRHGLGGIVFVVEGSDWGH